MHSGLCFRPEAHRQQRDGDISRYLRVRVSLPSPALSEVFSMFNRHRKALLWGGASQGGGWGGKIVSSRQALSFHHHRVFQTLSCRGNELYTFKYDH